MKRFLKITFRVIILFVAVILSYCTIVVIKARIDTPKIIKKALNADNMTLKLSDLNQWQIDALLTIEDPNFYKHNGMDLKTPGAGITTITQGLVKIYYFSHFKPGFAKLKQTLIAVFALNSLVSKNDQLRLFINNVYLGNVNNKLVIGFDKAANIYYNKPINQLTEREYLSIVAMIIAPQNFNILNRPEANLERTERLISVILGEYKPKSLMDIYYGQLDEETQKGLAPSSYFPSIYDKK
ncbi:MAG: biosynthetic peptidoglycan transglycosylase [bacterium]